eukprot:554675_1
MDADISVMELIKQYRNGSLTPLQHIQNQLTKLGMMNPRINPIAYWFDREQILKQAKDSTLRYQHNKQKGPFDGVPISVKPDYRIKGVRQCYASIILSLADSLPVAQQSEDLIKMMQEQGAIILCRTNISEFGYKSSNSSLMYGITRNPHNLMLTTGASSGGAGIGNLQLGSDGGGSIRLPAACCGVIGFKPSLCISKSGDKDSTPITSSLGPLARQLDDIILFMRQVSEFKKVLTNLDWSDKFIKNSDISDIKIAVSKNMNGIVNYVDPRIWNYTMKVVDYLKSMGADVEFIEPPLPRSGMNYWNVMMTLWKMIMVKDGKPFDEYNNGKSKYLVDEGLLQFIEKGKKLTALQIMDALSAKDEICEIMKRFMQKYDILITPSAHVLPYEALDPAQDWLVWDQVDGKRKHFMDCYHYIAAYTCLFNMTGQPAISMNVGQVVDFKYDQGDIPVGIQLVGPVDKDNIVLKMAYNLEKRFKTMKIPLKCFKGAHVTLSSKL